MRSSPWLPIVTPIAALCLTLLALPAEAVKCPNLHVVLDRSGSMTAVSGTGTRWTVARDAIFKVVDRYDGKLPIGLSIFPRSGCDSELAVMPDYKTKMAIQTAINRMGPSGSTPSGQAMHDAAQIKQLRDAERKQFVLLITDGGPGCGALDTVQGTVDEITKARMQNPPIFTFVVGFGGGLGASEKDALTKMAEAGGKPAATPEKFYKADDADGLNTALQAILAVVMDELGGGTCDDSCYSTPCLNAGDLCIRGNCAPNPCSGVTCGANLYCYTDGVSPGVCTKACTKQCQKGTICNQGSCVHDPCGYVCPPGLVCNAAAKRCESDPLCEDIPVDNQCKGTSRCRAGMCIDDPCRFITCPKNTTCVNWDGSCAATTGPVMMPDGGTDNTDFEGDRRGCAAAPGGAGAAPAASILSFAAVLLVLRRSRRRR